MCIIVLVIVIIYIFILKKPTYNIGTVITIYKYLHNTLYNYDHLHVGKYAM